MEYGVYGDLTMRNEKPEAIFYLLKGDYKLCGLRVEGLGVSGLRV